ncbi:MAG TPA: PaaI family thioesterase [Anaerolineales bacterium]|nr:PaaI family thioesterase [Anaerolineales bacterium]
MNEPAIQQPNAHNCFVCGVHNPMGLRLRFYDNGQDRVWSNLTVCKHHEGYPNVVHGGIIASILDEVAGRVTMIGNPIRFMMTATLEVKYRRPVPIEQELRAEGWLIQDRGRLAQVAGKLLLPDGALGAEMTATLATPPSTHGLNFGSVEELAALGWKVYAE